MGVDLGSDHVLTSEVTGCAGDKTRAHWVGGEDEQKAVGPSDELEAWR